MTSPSFPIPEELFAFIVWFCYYCPLFAIFSSLLQDTCYLIAFISILILDMTLLAYLSVFWFLACLYPFFLRVSDGSFQCMQIGTPICIPQKDFIDIGRLASIENNHKPVDYAKKGQKVAIKVHILDLGFQCLILRLVFWWTCASLLNLDSNINLVVE